MPDDQRKLLGQFIRSHRERVTPDAQIRRRRTPGLRREELAARAGIGVTWCAWIEQGRDVSVSPATLARLSDALSLTPAERAYLFELAAKRDPDAPQASTISQAPEAIRALVGILPHPAYGLDSVWNACCWNAAAEHLFGDWLIQGRQNNLLRYTFCDPSARKLLPDWAERARRILAEFRSDYSRHLNDSAWNDLVQELKSQSKLFAQEWDYQTVMVREGGLRTFQHPVDGLLTYSQHTFSPVQRADYKVVTLFPRQRSLLDERMETAGPS